MGSVLEKDLWTDKSISTYVGDIYEYDIRQAGFSICKELKLLTQNEIRTLSNKDNHDIHVYIGTKQRQDRVFNKKLQAGFKYFRLLFGKENSLTDTDIISVKRDAIFTKKYCDATKFHFNNIRITEEDTDFVEFREKHYYSSVLMFKIDNKDFEFYKDENNNLDVKGMNDKVVNFHKDGILKVIITFLKHLENYDEKSAIRFLVKTMNDYKFMRLPIDYYREFSASSGYRIYLSNGVETIVDNLNNNLDGELTIDYNYLYVLVPLLNILI